MKIKVIFRQFDMMRLLVLALLVLPVFVIFCFGLLWLWQSGNLFYWLGVLLLCCGLSYSLQQWLVRRDRQLLAKAAINPNPDWPLSAENAWHEVIKLADETDIKHWPLDDGAWMLMLGQRTLETVAHCYHPNAEKPILELTVPHALLIIEHASRDLRSEITDNIPFSDDLKIGDLRRIHHWKAKADRIIDTYRAGKAIINPLDAATSEIWRLLRKRSFSLATNELHRWLLHTYIRKIGYYAIDLYSGRKPLVLVNETVGRTTKSNIDINQAESNNSIPEEPLRILVMGRANTGKSSLINALFGKLTTKSHVIPDTTSKLIPFVLLRKGLTQALIFDSPSIDSVHFDQVEMEQAVLNADLILWVSSVNRPDRDSERQYLSRLRSIFFTKVNRRPPLLLTVASHIDQLRPIGSWQPPYDLTNSKDEKAGNIQAAIQAIAMDFEMPVSQVIPVNLRENFIYNVNDALWSAMMHFHDEALRVRLHRCLDATNQMRDWKKLRRQLTNAGRILWQLPDVLGKRTNH